MKDSILSYLNKNSLLASFVLAGIILLIILSTLPVRYIVNDDFAMITILRGNDFFSPSFHAVFLNPVMSWFLYSLYKLFPSIPWFGIVIYSTHLLGWSLIFSVVLRSDKLLYLVLSLPFLLACYVYHSCMVTFTSSSLFLLFGVLSCSFVFLSDKLSPINNRTSYSIFLALCFFLSFLLRWELVLYSILLGLPLIFFVKWQQVKIVIPLITILALLVCLNIGFIKIFESQEQPFYEYNKLRGDFHGTPKGDDNGQITLRAADKIGWDYEDYFSFRYYWLIFDNYTFNTHNLRIFLNENDLQKNLISNIPHIMGNISGSIKISAKDTLLFIISIASLFVFKAKYLINYNKIELFKILLTLVFYCIQHTIFHVLPFCSLGLYTIVHLYFRYILYIIRYQN